MRGEGRTTIALALGLVLAEYGLDTVLMEMDLGHPQLGQQLAVAKYPGVVDLAEGAASAEDVMRPIAPGLSLIPAGQLTSTAPRVMSQLARSEVVGDIVANGHVVVADLPPLLSNSSGHQAAALMSEVILVVRARTVGAGTIAEAVDGLAVKPKVLVNGTHTRVPNWALRLAGI
jgi:Mrp family chromosome partitioning ATPase